MRYVLDGTALEVEAWRLTPENVDNLAKHSGGSIVKEIDAEDPSKTFVGINVPAPDEDNVVRLSQGDYLVLANGMYHVVKPHHFESSYTGVE